MSNPYDAPNSKTDEILPARRYSHVLVAALTSLVFILTLTYFASMERSVDVFRVSLNCSVTFLLSLVPFLIIRRLPWYFSILMSLFITMVLIVVVSGLFSILFTGKLPVGNGA